MQVLSRAWNGDERLSKVFWFYYVPVVAAMQFAWYLIELQEGPRWIFEGLLAIPEIFYLVWILVSLWRCAFNCQVKLWGYVVRGLVVVHVVILVVAFVIITFSIYRVAP